MTPDANSRDNQSEPADEAANQRDPGADDQQEPNGPVEGQTGRGSNSPGESGPDSFSGNSDRAHDR